MSSAGTIDWERAPLGPGVRVLQTHPGGLAALFKPAGVLSHPNEAGDEARSLLGARYDAGHRTFAWPEAGGASRCWLLHRLDSATSGVILVATGEETANRVRALWERREVQKVYCAIVFGHPRERSAVWRDQMDVARETSRVRAGASGKLEAETAMRRLRLIPGPPALAAIELEPRTGRTHQLRYQCARRRLPIVGDQNYGDFRANRDFARREGVDRLFLHAARLSLTFPLAGRQIEFSAVAPLPEEFDHLLTRG